MIAAILLTIATMGQLPYTNDAAWVRMQQIEELARGRQLITPSYPYQPLPTYPYFSRAFDNYPLYYYQPYQYYQPYYYYQPYQYYQPYYRSYPQYRIQIQQQIRVQPQQSHPQPHKK